ncbi:protein of unknown function [Ruminococcaceae bacterium FB2012]|nr:protein of unknown function [Ruminococcaceae bacterium FB2012]
MINLFSNGGTHGAVLSQRKEFGIEGRPYITVTLNLHAGDIRKPFSVKARGDVYAAAYEGLRYSLLSDLASLGRALKKDREVCIWYSANDTDEYLGMLAFVEYLKSKDACIYLCDYSPVCKEGDGPVISRFELIGKPEIHLMSEDECNSILAELDRLKKENTGLRMLRNGKIESLPDDYFDEKILAAVKGETMVSDIYSRLFDDMPYMLDFCLLRLRRLIEMNKLITVEDWDDDNDEHKAFWQTVVRKMP